MKDKFLYRVSIRVLAFVISLILQLWFATCRVRVHGSKHRRQAEQEKSVVAVFWHYSLAYVFYHLKDVQAAVLVSASEDGEYIARLAQCLDFVTVRGSSNRGGLRALKELLAYLAKGCHVGMVADGSQGPPFVVQAGSILLASKSGSPVLPMAWSASRSFCFNSWDHTCIPMPFSQIDFFYGKPMLVPKNLDREDIEKYRIKLEGEMNSLYKTAWSHHQKEIHYND